jgi:hypothetical protein
VLPHRVHPLLPPPRVGFIQPATVVVATHVVDIFPLVVSEGLELAHHLGPLLILRDALRAGHIPHIDREVPRKRRAAFGPSGFGLPESLSQTVAAMALIGPNMGIPERPETEGLA